MIDLTITQILTTVSNWAAANPMMVIVILGLVLIIKGLALYKAARKEAVVWFWIILVFNTLGILPLLYLIFSKR